MNILIVEDRKDKRNYIKKAVQEMGISNIEVAKTYFSARNKIINLRKKYNLIILDMFLPDAKDDDELRGLAGKDLIFDMINSDIIIPIIVLTQYTEYTNNSMERKNNENPNMLENEAYGKELDNNREENYDCTYFEGLHEYLSNEVPIYVGMVFYSTQIKSWENNLKYFIDKIK